MSTATPATPSQADLPAIVSRKQLAAFLSVSDQTVDRLAKQWALPRIAVGRAVRFNASDVLAALNGERAAA
jgi:excisionase family DNA binding protein